MLNSPLREQARNLRAAVIPLKQESSILGWLQSSGRLISRIEHEQESLPEEEIDTLMGTEDGIGYDDLDDDDEISIEED